MKPILRRCLAAAIAAAAVCLLAAGIVRKHKVYEPDAGQFGLLRFYNISEPQLVIDATFSGVLRKASKLYSAYDRSAPRGKRTCPT